MVLQVLHLLSVGVNMLEGGRRMISRLILDEHPESQASYLWLWRAVALRTTLLLLIGWEQIVVTLAGE